MKVSCVQVIKITFCLLIIFVGLSGNVQFSFLLFISHVWDTLHAFP